MSKPSTTRPTTPPTTSREPITLVFLQLEMAGDECRLRAVGGPLRGSQNVHQWRFKVSELNAPILNEVGATMDSLSLAALLSAIGIQGELAYELASAAGALNDDMGPPEAI